MTASEATTATTATPEPLVLVTRGEGELAGVVTLTLNRPRQFNALSIAMLDALQRALDDTQRDASARVVVLAAAGPAFCAGHDLKEMRAEPSLDSYRALFNQCTRVMLTMQRMPQPVIARVHGIATAAGCQLVAMCDLAVATSAARFAVSGINVGLFCATPGVALSRNLSRKQAMEMLLTGDFIDAQTARERGLVNRVVAMERLDAEVAALCRSILAKPAAAVAAGKGLFYRQVETGIEAAYQMAGQTMACNMMDECALEGVQAFIEKRAPDWAKRPD
ncbi:enoyl-CoA hydratase [Pandoraea cepalis]|uniref:Enoyl-CoA hydratase domain-containing protein 3, mitochondrial n=1 Tax=Pandoraea cepalis TaxID=2508294 RepID=A0A5E4UC06_9BURK|nr:enoyl-CoA hydratase [Pandoraea cepalis]VVD97560.1 enoyl-CoA hydratase [Pandoraea cepalis]